MCPGDADAALTACSNKARCVTARISGCEAGRTGPLPVRWRTPPQDQVQHSTGVNSPQLGAHLPLYRRPAVAADLQIDILLLAGPLLRLDTANIVESRYGGKYCLQAALKLRHASPVYSCLQQAHPRSEYKIQDIMHANCSPDCARPRFCSMRTPMHADCCLLSTLQGGRHGYMLRSGCLAAVCSLAVAQRGIHGAVQSLFLVHFHGCTAAVSYQARSFQQQMQTMIFSRWKRQVGPCTVTWTEASRRGCSHPSAGAGANPPTEGACRLQERRLDGFA